MAVITAFEFDDACAASVATSQADCRHGGLGSRAHQAYLLHRGNASDDGFSNLDFSFGRGAEGQTIDGRLLYRLDDFGMSMPQNCGTPRADVIDVAGAFSVPGVSTLGTLNET